MSQSSFQCPHGVVWENTCLMCEEESPANQTAEEALQEIFDQLKCIPLCDLTERERFIITIVQFHGVKV